MKFVIVFLLKKICSRNKIILIVSLFFTLTNSYAQVTNERRIVIKPAVQYKLKPVSTVHFSGYLGDKMHAVINNNIMMEDVEALIEPFRHRTETSLWQTEFWGKWMLSAAKAYEYNHDSALLAKMKTSVEEILSTQSNDGYIGNYAPGKHLQAWDIWGRKYTLLGLLYYYDITGDKHVLTSAKKLADHLLSEVGPGKVNIVLTGSFRGMASSSILEPIVLLYERTGDKKYLNFASYIVHQWETQKGPQLISKGLNNVPVSNRFSDSIKNWWGWENGRKAYEMMSCYDGLLELYHVTGNKSFLNAVIKVVKNIKDDEINIVGSGAASECWYKGRSTQYYPAMHTMETCVTITWMKLCYDLYRLTGDEELIENIETSAYNNLQGSLLPDGSRFSKYSALQGFRDLDGYQCNMNINCCMANGPRGFTLLPDAAVMQSANGIYINFYNSGQANLNLSNGKNFSIDVNTDYPVNNEVLLKLDPPDKIETSINLRIPSWSTNTKIEINGAETNQQIKAGEYFKLTRPWIKGDVIKITFDLRGRVITVKNNYQTYKAIVRGPIVLARDNRFGDYNIDSEILNDDREEVMLEPVKLKNVWMGFNYTFTTGTGENSKKITVPLIDFSSAGNDWKSGNRYKVWVPVIYNVSGLKD